MSLQNLTLLRGGTTLGPQVQLNPMQQKQQMAGYSMGASSLRQKLLGGTSSQMSAGAAIIDEMRRTAGKHDADSIY